MLTYDHLSRKPQHFLSFVGLSLAQFDPTYPAIEADYAAYHRKRLDRPDRKRAVGAGGQFHLPLRERLVLTLMGLRLYLSYPLLGYLFDLDASNVYRNIQATLPLLKAHLPLPERLDPQGGKVTDLAELQAKYPDLIALVDATEPPVRRPQGGEAQKPYYSGKKKRHTRKTQLTVPPQGVIPQQTPSVPGATHDYALFKQTGGEAHLPLEVALYTDKGYQGLQKDYPDRVSYVPKKATKRQPLSEADKAENRRISSMRSQAEHTISKLKKYKILSDCYRHSHKTYDTYFGVVTGLVNLRTMDRLEKVRA